MEESGQNSSALAIAAPQGMYPAKLDDKGRLKLPTIFQTYFNSLPEAGKLFVTSLDARTAQIYPINAWHRNQELFENYTEDPEALESLLFTAQELGSEVEMDAQGRLTVNPELRKELDLQGQDLHLYAYKGRIEILTEAIYQERRRRARPNAVDNVRKLEKAGMK